MTWDDAFKGFVALVGTGVTAVVGWLIKSTLGNREEILLLKEKNSRLEAEMVEVKKNSITQECVREVVEEALEKRDKLAETRRKEWDRMHSLEIKQAVGDEVEKLTDKILREVRTATGRHSASDLGRVRPGDAG